ncbi:MAG: iron-containing alcohol dehydrogenase [Candidatus Cloacimonetes bacterium]|nr:iron-containing alcohol dehydrogenase [Candidatus Cloacimonadota bacterium]MDD3236124.1 iron-containing alcohol dehydrogenase [Candidatus Cloacimonadota bacterium]
MEAFTFYNPTRIHFGVGMITQLGAEMQLAGIKSCLMVAGNGSIKENSVYTQVMNTLSKHGIKVHEAWGVRANPTLSKVREIVAIAKETKAEAILAVGGGSVIDTAKTVAAGVFLADPWDAFCTDVPIVKALPIYTVLTLSATGSEMNGNAVISNTETKQKWAFYSPLVYPKVSIIDPTVQCSLPFKQTANGAMDAIAHILEYYFTNQIAFSTLGIDDALQKTIVEMTDRLKLNPSDLIARGNLAWCATLALNGISGLGLSGGDWACHQIEHSFSAMHPDIAHGEGLGVIMPAWIEYMSEKDPSRFVRWSKNVWGEDSVSRGIMRFREKLEAWGMATSMRDLGIKERDLPELLELIMITDKVGDVSKLSAADVEALLMLAY